MAGTGGVSLAGLAMIASGAVLVYSGINDPVGGPVGVVTDVLKGKMPTPQHKAGPFESAFTAAAGNAKGAATAQRVLSVASTYLGVPYVWAGESYDGVDCSGLVLVAYRDGAGIKLPHFATSQAALARQVPRSDIQPADLVAWGVPGNYPHIALAMDADTVIVAPTFGEVVQFQPLMEAKVSGFGLPDIYRIL